jgi:hypothetical protein
MKPLLTNGHSTYLPHSLTSMPAHLATGTRRAFAVVVVAAAAAAVHAAAAANPCTRW